MFTLTTKLYKELTNVSKTGMIPWMLENGEIKMVFAVSSDPAFGGDKPMIAKGFIDVDETPLRAARREAKEELGLKNSNVIQGTEKIGYMGTLSGIFEDYNFTVFSCQVKNKEDFNQHDFEIN